MASESGEIIFRTVLELDLAAYSDIAFVLEENLDVYAVKALEDQVQSFVDGGLDQVGLQRTDVVFGSAGDNAILVFENAALMHRFAEAVQQAVAAHNAQKTVDSARRWFRMGAATGPILWLQTERRVVGTTVARAVRLEAAANRGELLVDAATYDLLPDKVKALYGDEEEICGKRKERFVVRRCTFVTPSRLAGSASSCQGPVEPKTRGTQSVTKGRLVSRSTAKEKQPSPAGGGDEGSRLYLSARYYLEKRTEEGLRQSIASYYQILDKDPTAAPAWIGLAYAYHMLSVWGHASPSHACPKAKSAALRALELDDSLGEAHTTIAAIRMEYDWDLIEAERVFRQALAMKPDHAYAHQLYGKCLACLGRHDEAIAAFRRAEQLDPLSRTIGVALGRHGFILARRYHEAIDQLRKTIETDARFWLAHRFLGWAYLFDGNISEALKALTAAHQLEPNAATLVGLGYAFAVAGQPGKAHETLNALAELARHSYVAPDCQAIVYIGLGDHDHAFGWLEKAVEHRSEWLCKAHVDPVLDPLRSDPRFSVLLQRVNRT